MSHCQKPDEPNDTAVRSTAIFFRPRTQPGSTWPPLVNADASQVWATYRELERTQWLVPAEIIASQLAQVRSLLNHCVKNVPYYRRLLAEHGIVPDQIQTLDEFRRIPILTRRTYQEQFLHMTAGSLPPGTRATAKLRTSGTRGMPVEVHQTNVVNLWWVAFFLRDLQWCGIDPLGQLASIRATAKSGAELDRLLEGVSLPNWSKWLDAVIETGSAHVMDVHQDPTRQLEWLSRVQPDYLLSYPSNLEFLAALASEASVNFPRLRVIQCISEGLSDDARACIEAAFGVPVKNTYSCVEAGYIASPCPEGSGLHVHSENVLVEVVDSAGRPCAPGQTGRVVLTTLHNFLCPFVRYDIMDEAEAGPARCPCGRGLPVLNRVQGKRRPLLSLPDGRVKNFSALATGLRKIGGLYQFQVVQRAADDFLIRLVPDRSWTESHAARIRDLVCQYCNTTVRVQVLPLDRIELPRGGKLLDFVTELEPRDSSRT